MLDLYAEFEKMELPKRTLDQTLRRVSQMRRLGLSLREAYDEQYRLPLWLARFEVLRNLPAKDFPTQFSRDDLDALRAGIRQNWSAGNYAGIAASITRPRHEIFSHLLGELISIMPATSVLNLSV